MGRGRLDGLEGEISGDAPAHEVGYRGGERVEGVEDDCQRESANDCVGLGDLGALLKVVENWVLGQLLKMSE